MALFISYGKHGVVAIFNMLIYSLFAHHHNTHAWGFLFCDFVQQVLVLQAATLLIAQDLDIDEDYARQLKDASMEYSLQEYPYDK